MMNNTELKNIVNELIELQQLADDLKVEIDNLKDTVKAEMTERNIETLDLDEHVVRFQTILSQRFNSTELKKKLPEIYTAYLKQVTSKKFVIA